MKSTLHRIARKVERQQKRARRITSQKEATEPLGSASGSAPTPSVTVLGPYPNRSGYRLVIKENGVREARCFSTLEEAQQVRDELLREVSRRQGLTVGALLELFRRHLVEVRGAKPETGEHVVWCIKSMIPADVNMASLTTDKVRSYYLALTQRIGVKSGKPISASTHQVALCYAKNFGKWAVEAKHLLANPFAGVSPVGKRSAGKLQLTISEALKLDTVALDGAQRGDPRCLGILLMIHLGLRRGEVGARMVRDVDQEGGVLWIPHGKTRNARRRLKVPEFLRPLLRAQTEGKEQDALLFTTLSGKPVHHNYFWNYLKQLCVKAGVPVVCPHSLRGLHATLALEEGATSESVARALGHGSFSMTKKHYATADSVSSNLNQRISRAMGTDARTWIAEFLSSLSPPETAELKRQLSLS